MRRLLIALSLMLTVAGGAATAQSAAAKATVDSAKAEGAVGEKADGFLGLVSPSAPAPVKSAVAEINAGRAQAYRDIAAKTGVSESTAAEATARQLIARLPPGAYYKPLDGGWSRK